MQWTKMQRLSPRPQRFTEELRACVFALPQIAVRSPARPLVTCLAMATLRSGDQRAAVRAGALLQYLRGVRQHPILRGGHVVVSGRGMKTAAY